jgi:hypothetical protein
MTKRPAALARLLMRLASMGDRGLPDIVREIIAKRIIAAAKQGERDPKQLCNTALAALGIDDQLGRFSGDVA